MAKITNFILFVILLGLMGTLVYQAYQFYPSNEQNLIINLRQTLPETNASSNFSQFVPNMRFNSANLNYYIYPGCTQEKLNRIKMAFNELSEKTQILQFTERQVFDEKTDIKIFCTQLEKEIEKNKFIAGEGGPDEYLNLSLYPLIISGEVYLYDSLYSNDCEYPIVELHELLHVFGFDHVNKKNSIMYPYSSCDQKIDIEIINEIKRLYSEKAKSDLLFSSATASKAGRYLDFETEIQNRGLIDAEFTQLKIYNKEKLIETFDMENIQPGTTKTLTIKNLVLDSRNINEIKFSLETAIPEYFYENNEFTAKLE